MTISDVARRPARQQARRALVRAARRARMWLPEGRAVPEQVWNSRHRWIIRFSLLQAFVVACYGAYAGRSALACLVALAVIGIPSLLGTLPSIGRRPRTLAATASLMFASAVVVDFAGTAVEAHFHFFVMLGVVALYQDWSAFGLCVLITVLHHSVFGLLNPGMVFGHGMEGEHPVRWAVVHGAFILAASVTHLLAWKANEQQALSDQLTRLPNRTAFLERLDRALLRDRPAVSVLLVDLDNFKYINDSGGHRAGDRALQHAARALLESVRDGDVVARIGGDEFAVLLDAPVQMAAEVAERIVSALRSPTIVDGREVFVRASIGAAESSHTGGCTAAELLQYGDLALYLAKSSGKDQVVVYSEQVDSEIRERAQLRTEIGHALENDEFEVVYQPAVRGSDYSICGVEALLRWHNPRRGTVSPVEFIPIAEETGEIRAIGAWVLKQATAQVGQWREHVPGLADLEIAVNLSPVQLRDPGLLALLSEAIVTSGLPADAITLEVTESMMLADLDLSRRQLDAARILGSKVAIDDFGTGYSSLSYLSRLPADQVKIDRSFIRDLGDSNGSLALVKGIIDLAKALHLDIQAEGVEDDVQEAILGRLGCPRLQGYRYAKPLSADALVTFARDYRPVEVTPRVVYSVRSA